MYCFKLPGGFRMSSRFGFNSDNLPNSEFRFKSGLQLRFRIWVCVRCTRPTHRHSYNHTKAKRKGTRRGTNGQPKEDLLVTVPIAAPCTTRNQSKQIFKRKQNCSACPFFVCMLLQSVDTSASVFFSSTNYIFFLFILQQWRHKQWILVP